MRGIEMNADYLRNRLEGQRDLAFCYSVYDFAANKNQLLGLLFLRDATKLKDLLIGYNADSL